MNTGTIFITGASSGIGLALAHEYAKRGWHVGALARRESLLQELTASLRASYPKQSFAYAVADVTDEKTFFAALDSLVTMLGSPQVFIANSGIGKGIDPRQPMWNHVRHILMTNIIGTIAGLEYIKDYWVRRHESGHLVGISSVAGIRGLPGTAAYSCSKAALATYMESVRGELTKTGIHATCVYPGFVRTPMTATNPWMPWLLEPEDAARRIADAIEKRRQRFTFPFPMRIVRCLLKHMPDFLFDFIARHTRSYKKVD